MCVGQIVPPSFDGGMNPSELKTFFYREFLTGHLCLNHFKGCASLSENLYRGISNWRSVILILVQQGSEIWTCADFQWSKRGHLTKGLDFKLNLKSGCQKLFEIHNCDDIRPMVKTKGL